MKNTIKFGIIAIFACLAAILSSCDDALALGEKLNLDGPVVTILGPAPRQPVDGKFVMEGTVTDRTGVARLLVKARYSKELTPGNFVDSDFDMQWRYTPAAGWDVSLDFGATWMPAEDVNVLDGSLVLVPESPEWDGAKETGFTWRIPIDLGLYNDLTGLEPDRLPPDGQYQFSVTAWNPAGYSDANSFKTRTVNLVKDPPLATIITPFLYRDKDDYSVNTSSEFYRLNALAETEANRQNPLYLGKFLNGPINLQWQIESPNDVWSIDIRLYKAADELGNAGVPPWEGNDNWVYRINVNADESRPAIVDPNETVKFNGRAQIPDLSSGIFGNTFVPKNPATGQGGYWHQQKTQITAKTPMFAVVLCMDAAGHLLEDSERFQGLFIYWPDSDIPWLTLPDGLKPSYGGAENVYMAFPNSDVPVRAFDDDGVARVEYTLYSIANGTPTNAVPPPGSLTPLGGLQTEPNTTHSRAFSWSFSSPVEAGDYYVSAQAFDIYDIPSPIVTGRFEVKDVSFPDISPPTAPLASSPLFRYIDGTGVDNWSITITGKASHFTALKSVSMVWINPHSVNYAAMSQLSYFRDPEYYGWANAPALHTAPPFLDTTYDTVNPNKVWTMDIDAANRVHNDVTDRWEYTYTKTLNLKTDLNIAPGQDTYDYLKSQVFVLKATDTDGIGKSTIITWAPQGDSEAPKVRIDRVRITTNPGGAIRGLDDMQRDSGTGMFPFREQPLAQFVKKNEANVEELNAYAIIIDGTWEEDSAEYLTIVQNELKNNLIVKIGQEELTDVSLSATPFTTKTLATTSGAARGSSGTWTATGRLGMTPDYKLVATALKDTLVISAVLTDIGGNISEDGISWLIESDELRFLRVGSDTGDGTYSNLKDGLPTDVDIFLEFNKPVTLESGAAPRLILSSAAGTAAFADYNAAHPDHHQDKDPLKPIIPSSRQHFTYRVLSGHSTGTEVLNLAPVAGGRPYGALTVADSQFSNDATYPYIWKTISGEEIRMVMSTAGKTWTGYQLGTLPVSTLPTAVDYLYTLAAGKHIRIDTTSPKLLSLVKNVKDSWYGAGSFLYFTATFDKDIKTGAALPALVTNLKNNRLGTQNIKIGGTVDTVQINRTQAIFVYEIQEDDYTPSGSDGPGSPGYGGFLQITGLDGMITDMAQNAYTPVPVTDFPKTFGGGALGTIQVKAVKPPTPTLDVMSNPSTVIGTSGGGSFTWDPGDYLNSGAFDAAFLPGSTDIVRLKNLYIDNLYVRVTPAGASGPDYERVQYSINYGKDWAQYNTPFATPKEQTTPGRYDITSRQIDMAGNVSDWSKPVTLNWDKGDLLTRITSSHANGIYTNNLDIGGGRGDVIPITLYFRKPIIFVADPIFTLSAVDGGGSNKQLSPARPMGPVTSFTFNYTVGPNDTTGGQPLDLQEIIYFSATDEDGVDISHLINLNLAMSQQNLLKDLKNIIIQTGAPIRTEEPRFYDDTTRTGWNVQTSPNFQGVKDTDDSYWTSMLIEYDRDIFKSGTMLWGGSAYDVPNVLTVIQRADGYRLPAVLTESQWSRYNSIPNIRNFYTKGINGYRAGIGADTSVKYILNFDQDAYNIAPNGAAAAGTIEKLADDFRKAEMIEMPINTSQIEVYNSPAGVVPEVHRVTIRLSNNNALKVPGASYEIKFPAGFVQDLLGNPCEIYPPAVSPDPGTPPVLPPSPTPQQLEEYNNYYGIRAAPGVSRPFMRISTPQEKISVADGGGGRPSYSSSQPWFYVATADRAGTAQLRMDSRTPGSVVRYAETSATTSTNNLANNNADWTTSSSNVTYGPGNDPGQPGLPTAASDSFGRADFGPVPARSIGPAAASNIFQGYRLRVRARGNVGAALSAAASEEVLYRSVLTFKGTSTQSGVSRLSFANGDSVWVRGGDTLYGATIPGFPIDSADDYFALSANKERAGMRLMTRVNTDSTSLADSAWQWVTWDIKAVAYIGVYLGRDTTTDAARAYQYGPLKAASQTGNWSMAKLSYALQPGGHRWLSSSNPDYTNYKGSNTPPFTWVAAFDERPPNGDGSGGTLQYTLTNGMYP